MTHDIHFDEENHRYTVNGEVKQSVTRIMRGAGLLGDYDSIPQHYMDRGTRVHDACELVAQGWITGDEVDDDIKVYVKTFERLMFELGLSYVDSEVPCYDPEYDYCGKFDLIMMWNGKKTLVELKTSKVDMFHGIQIAAYERMVDVEDVLGIELKTGYVFTKAPDWHLNHEAWRDICTGFFDLEEWKKYKKRRRMTRIL
jgi:hypothetical protein